MKGWFAIVFALWPVFAAPPAAADQSAVVEMILEAAQFDTKLNDEASKILFELIETPFLSGVESSSSACPNAARSPKGSDGYKDLGVLTQPIDQTVRDNAGLVWAGFGASSVKPSPAMDPRKIFLEYNSGQGAVWTYEEGDAVAKMLEWRDNQTAIPQGLWKFDLSDGSDGLEIMAVGNQAAARFMIGAAQGDRSMIDPTRLQRVTLDFDDAFVEGLTNEMAKTMNLDPETLRAMLPMDWTRKIFGPWDGSPDIPCPSGSQTAFASGAVLDYTCTTRFAALDPADPAYGECLTRYRAMMEGTYLVASLRVDALGSEYEFGGGGALHFLDLPTVVKKLQDKHARTRKLCDLDGDQDSLHARVIAEFSSKLSLGRCGGAMVRVDGSGVPHFATAAHCLEQLANPAYRTFLVGDFWDGDPGMNFAGKSFTSDDWIEITGRTCLGGTVCSPREPDIAILPLDASEVDPARLAPLDLTGQPKVGSEILARGFPLGAPRQSIGPQNTPVRLVDDEAFYAEIDNFAMSSGSPVFSEEGQVIGILTEEVSSEFFDETPECVALRSNRSPETILRSLLPQVISGRAFRPLVGG